VRPPLVARARRGLPAGLLCLAALCAASSPTTAEVVFDNPTSQILRNNYISGARAPRHTHRSGRFIFVLSGGTLRVSTKEPKEGSAPPEPGRPPELVLRERDILLTSGSASFRCPETHAIENVGSGEISVFEVEMKEADGSSCAPEDTVADPPQGEVAGSGQILFRNRFGTVLLHHVAPRETLTPAFPGHDRAFLWLSGGVVRVTMADGTVRLVPHHPGEFNWLAGGRETAGVNEGAAPIDAVEIVIERALPSRRIVIRNLD